MRTQFITYNFFCYYFIFVNNFVVYFEQVQSECICICMYVCKFCIFIFFIFTSDHYIRSIGVKGARQYKKIITFVLYYVLTLSELML